MPKRSLLSFFALAGLLLATLPGAGQSLNEVLFSVGTSMEDEDGDGAAAAYLLWQARDLSQLQDRRIAVYSKAGKADSLQPYSFDGVARTRLQPAAIRTLLQRGEALGDEETELESNIDNLFENLLPDTSLPLEDKISAVVGGAIGDPELYENLIFLSRRHPGMSLILGTGFSATYPNGWRTFELRSCPAGFTSPDSECLEVIGRITVEVGSPRPLPAPGRPVYVPFSDGGDPDPRAHLNVPLRWATPDPLRERSLLQFGFNIFRVPASDAEAAGWDSNPPPPDLLADLGSDPGDPTQLVNKAPVLPERMLDASEAADTVSDPETYFHIDDNDRYDPGGQPFENGDQYYYFITGRDLLGRNGEVSEGTEVLICDFQPPPQPKRVNVENHYNFDAGTDTNTQHFKVSWEAPDTSDTMTPETITGYRVYRWWSIDEMHQKEAFPDDAATDTVGGLVAVLPASARSFIDDDADAPFLETVRLADGSLSVDQSYGNKTFWYTVRAVDGSACGGNLSGNSAPAYGVLRDRIGPPRPDGNIRINCVDLRIVAPKEVQSGREFIYVKDPVPGTIYLTLQGFNRDAGVEWIEFALLNPSSGEVDTFYGRFPFEGEEDLVSLRKAIAGTTGNDQFQVAARVGNDRGKVTNWYDLGVSGSEREASGYLIRWEGWSETTRTAPGEECDYHVPLTPSGTVTGIDINLTLTETTEEWKVYRRVNDSGLSLIRQGLDSFAEVVTVLVEDNNLPAGDTRVCYFVQVFDEHGNPSPIVRVGCTGVEGKEPLPEPMLSPPSPRGDQNNPEALLTWFCPPYGVERFEVQVAAGNGDLPAVLGDAYNSPEMDFDEDERTWRPFPTRLRTGITSGNSPEVSTLLTGVETGREYTFRVRAIGPSGRKGPYSNEETFVWNPDTDGTVTGPNVPWPARSLPPLGNAFHPDILARTFVVSPYQGAGVRIGLLDYSGIDIPRRGKNEWGFNLPPGAGPPVENLFTDEDGNSLEPFALYRYQIPNGEFPEVSGDVYQVSPLLEDFPAVMEFIEPYPLPSYRNYDPYLVIDPSKDQPQNEAWFDLLVKDTQPMVSGAAYRYLIVRFDPTTKEILEILPTNTVTIP